MRQFVCYRSTVSHSLSSSNHYMSRIPFPILRVLDLIAYVLAVFILSKYQRQYANSSKKRGYLTFVIQANHELLIESRQSTNVTEGRE